MARRSHRRAIAAGAAARNLPHRRWPLRSRQTRDSSERRLDSARRSCRCGGAGCRPSAAPRRALPTEDHGCRRRAKRLLARLERGASAPERRSAPEPRRTRQGRRCRGPGLFRAQRGRAGPDHPPRSDHRVDQGSARTRKTRPVADDGERAAVTIARRSSRQRRRSSRSSSNTWTSPPPQRCRAPSSRRSSPGGSRTC